MNNQKKQYYTSQAEIIAMQDELCSAKIDSSLRKKAYLKHTMIRYGGKVIGIFFICLLCKLYIDVESAKAKGEVPTVFGYQIYEVQSGSMDPTLPVKSLIIAKQYDGDQVLETGEIITFEHEGTIITHRIVEVHHDGNKISYVTKGDNAQNTIDPKPVYPNEIKATFVTKLPFYLSSEEGDDHG